VICKSSFPIKEHLLFSQRQYSFMQKSWFSIPGDLSINFLFGMKEIMKQLFVKAGSMLTGMLQIIN